jgi:hypothetical protein
VPTLHSPLNEHSLIGKTGRFLAISSLFGAILVEKERPFNAELAELQAGTQALYSTQCAVGGVAATSGKRSGSKAIHDRSHE